MADLYLDRDLEFITFNDKSCLQDFSCKIDPLSPYTIHLTCTVMEERILFNMNDIDLDFGTAFTRRTLKI